MNDPHPVVRNPGSRLPLRWKVAGLSVLAVAVVAGAGLFHGVGGKPAAPPAKTVPVVTGRATTRDMPIWFSGVGSVTPINVVDVKARVDGQLVRLAFSEGDEDPAGRLLAQIDPRPYQAALAQAQATRAKDLAQLVNAQQEVTRTTALSKAGAGTSQAADAATAQAGALKATVAADDAAITAARLNLQFASITAPIAGRVGLRQVNLGSIVHASDTTGIVTVTQMAPISVLFALSQDALGPVLAGQKSGPLQVALYPRDGTSRIASGRLVFVGSSVDPTTGQFQLRANFANADRGLWPGEFVSARVLVHVDRHVVAVPDQAVMTSETGRFIYVLKPDATADVRPVTVGPSVEGFTEILSGLKSGEAIVTAGQSRLSAGAKVTASKAQGAQS